MAKNNRATTGKQVPLTERTTKSAKKRKISRGRITVLILVGILMLLSLVFMILMGRYIYRQLFAGSASVPSVDLTPFEHTDEQYRDKVSYYVLGILGDEQQPTMQALSLVCHNKQNGTMSILQIPRDLYIKDEEIWGQVYRAGDTFAQPKPYDWCDVCKQRLYSGQITEDGRHNVCRVTVSQREGSAVLSLMDVFNDQLGMPVDHFFLLPQQAFIKLVDLMDGVTLELEESITVGTLTYAKGVQTIDGEAALYYMTERGESEVQGDIERMSRQRTVMACVLEQLLAQSEQNYRNDTIVPIQSGSTPIRSDLDKEEMVSFLLQLRSVTVDKITVSTLPGTVVTHQSEQYYSADRSALTDLLNQHFNPFGPKVATSDVRVPELTDADGRSPDTKSLADYLPKEGR